MFICVFKLQLREAEGGGAGVRRAGVLLLASPCVTLEKPITFLGLSFLI